MKKRLTTLIAFLALLAVPTAAQGQGKIGVININAAIAGTGEGKKAIADLQQKYQPRQQELERLQTEITNIQNQLSKATSDDEQRRLSRDLEDKQKILKRSTDDAQSDFNSDRDEAIRRIGQKMVRIIQEYAPQNGMVLVIDGAQVPIYYAAKELDITEAIVKRYDAANPVAGAPAAPVQAPASPSTKPK